MARFILLYKLKIEYCYTRVSKIYNFRSYRFYSLLNYLVTVVDIFVTIYNYRAHNYFITIVMKFVTIFRALMITIQYTNTAFSNFQSVPQVFKSMLFHIFLQKIYLNSISFSNVSFLEYCAVHVLISFLM